MSYYNQGPPPPGQPPYHQQGYQQQGFHQGPPPPGPGFQQGFPPPQGQGSNQGYYGGPPAGSPYPPQGAPFQPPPGQYNQPLPQQQQGHYGQQPGYGQHPQPAYGTPPPGPPAPPSPGYIPGQQSHVDMSRAADDLRAAMKGFGTNENQLIKVLSSLGPLEINGVKAAFQVRHHRDLVKDVHSETSGNFRQALEGILRGPLDQDCHALHESISGLGTKESAMNDVLLGRTNADLNAIKAHYHHKFHRTLEADVKGDLSMKTERMFDMVMSARRNEESAPVYPQQTEDDVREIYGATEGRSGTDQMTVCHILTSRSDGQIRAIAHAYRQKYHRSLDECLRKEFSGHMEQALTYIVRKAEDQAKHDADLLEDAMRGLGTNDQALIRRVIMIHWDPQRLQQCKAAYKHFYKRDLAQRIRDETSGDYKKLMVASIGEHF